jgi:vancomycin resistance protein YoaR
MATENLDLVDEIPGAASSASTPASSAAAPGESVSSAVWASSPSEADAGPAVKVSPLSVSRRRRRTVAAAQMLVAFVVATVVSLGLVVAAALFVAGSYADRVLPGVHVGNVDVSGLTRDEAVAKLQTSFAYLNQGTVTISTPLREATITYQDAGRGPDVDFMAQEAMAIGHTGDPLADAVYVLRSALSPQTVAIAARLDPTAVATHVRALVDTDQVAPKNAQAMPFPGYFWVEPGTPGSSLDEVLISSAIVDHLSQANVASDFKIGDAVITIKPAISDGAATDAVAQAERMIAPLTLAWTGDKPATFTIDAQTIRSWISFRVNPDGSYGPAIDTGAVQAYLEPLKPKVATKPVEPKVGFDAAGKPTSLNNGKDGSGMDTGATADAIGKYLLGVGAGTTTGSSVAIVPAPISPVFTPESLAGLSVQGAWTTIFYPDISNGFGANIRVPAVTLNGQIIAPGQQFSFLRAVGPVDRAHGYTLGGVIKNGKSDHTGAMGGGICSASTTTFNAAARAGLRIDERHAHAYYIYRYPVGLDATVFSNGFQTYDMRFTNDTPNPIIIRAWTTRGSKSTITVQLWSKPMGRKVTFSPEFKANLTIASDKTIYTTKLAPGTKARAEYPTNGFSTSRTRTVTDATGKIIHQDTWVSHYVKVNGLLEIGVAKAPAPTPTAVVVGSGLPYTVPAAPSQAPAPRRRRTR